MCMGFVPVPNRFEQIFVGMPKRNCQKWFVTIGCAWVGRRYCNTLKWTHDFEHKNI